MLNQTRVACVYTKLDNGVHYFTFHESSKRAIDEWVNYLTAIVEQTPPDGVVRYVLDVRESGMLPVRHAYQRGKEWFARYKSGPKYRTAILHKQDVLMSITQSFINLLRANDQWAVRFFPGADEAEAVAWLLRDV